MFKGYIGKNLFVMRLTAFVGIAVFSLLSFSAPVHAVAKESTLSLSVQANSIDAFITPLKDGTFGQTNVETITVGTDNYSGYSLSIKTLDGTDLTSEYGAKINSIESAVSEYAFVTNSDYNNKWGFKPSQYIENGSVVNNNYFLPVPVDSMLIAKSSSANSVANGQISTDTYTFTSGARVDKTIPIGSYSNTFVISVLANSLVYNITYDGNTTGTVYDMPSPNPQPITISGDTPVVDSYATLSDAIPYHDQKIFIGWCDEATTTNLDTGNDNCPGNLYSAGDRMPLDQTAAPNITLYAVWTGSKFPIVWSQRGACEFHGATNGNITGSECVDYHNTRFIDTGIALYSNENYLKDYEMHLKFDSYNPADQVDYFGSEDGGQQTFANDKPEVTAGDKKAPGAVIRRDRSLIEFSSKMNNERITKNVSYTLADEVSIYRINGIIYYQVNDGSLILLQDITGFNQQFGLNAWFGAYPRDDCDGNNGPCTEPKRIPEATLSNMYIRLGDYPDENTNTIVFSLNGVTSDTVATYLVQKGEAVKTLPSAPSYSKHYFMGWFTESAGGTKITASTVPATSTTYYAHWLKTVELAVFDNENIELSMNDNDSVVVSNSSELEPYKFISGDTSILTVDENTGEITPVGIGTTTITVRGDLSRKTRSVNVEVAAATYNVSFDSRGGSAINNIAVLDGNQIDPLPVSYLTGFQFEGWYTEPGGAGTKLTTSTVFGSDTATQYYANWEEAVTVCKAATEQHTETCNRNSGGCRNAGYAKGATISYGSLITTPGTAPVVGDAFTCDINADRVYDEDDERFYYFGTEDGKAKLAYYKNIADINESYSVGLSRLPVASTPGWTNTNLVPYSSGDYFGKVARLMSRGEAVALCDNKTSGLGSNGRCLYLLEKSNFSDTLLVDGWWLGSTNNSRIHTGNTNITNNSGVNAVRPVIEIPMSLISY